MSVITALIIGAAFFAVHAVTQAGEFSCEHDGFPSEVVEISQAEDSSSENPKRPRRGRGYIGSSLR